MKNKLLSLFVGTILGFLFSIGLYRTQINIIFNGTGDKYFLFPYFEFFGVIILTILASYFLLSFLFPRILKSDLKKLFKIPALFLYIIIFIMFLIVNHYSIFDETGILFIIIGYFIISILHLRELKSDNPKPIKVYFITIILYTSIIFFSYLFLFLHLALLLPYFLMGPSIYIKIIFINLLPVFLAYLFNSLVFKYFYLNNGVELK